MQASDDGKTFENSLRLVKNAEKLGKRVKKSAKSLFY